MRRWLLAVLVLLALQLLPGVAWAAYSSAPEAYAAAQAEAAAWDAVGNCGGHACFDWDFRRVEMSFHSYYKKSSSSSWVWHAVFDFSSECPDGGAWDDTTHTCFDAEQCLSMSPQDTGIFNVTLSGGSVCDSGCKRVYRGGTIQQLTTSSGATISVGTGGKLETNGESCESGASPVPASSNQACFTDVATGRETCVNKEGKNCYKLSSMTREMCWRPGETGEKTDGPVLQVRNAGSTATPPLTDPPAGTTFVQDGQATTVTNQSTDVDSGVVVTSTTTTTDYKTASGTDAGEVDVGEPADGSGSDGGDGGEGDSGDGEDDGSVSGGVDCDSPPIVTGDPILANIVLQTWGTRCAIESDDTVQSTGEIGDCSSPWSVSGPADDANVQKLKAARAEICGDYLDGNGNGQPDWTEGDAPSIPGEGEPAPGDEPGSPDGIEVGTGLLDMDGILGTAASAPSLGVLDFGQFGSFDMDSVPYWSDLVVIMRAIVLLVCAFAAIKILMGAD